MDEGVYKDYNFNPKQDNYTNEQLSVNLEARSYSKSFFDLPEEDSQHSTNQNQTYADLSLKLQEGKDKSLNLRKVVPIVRLEKRKQSLCNLPMNLKKTTDSVLSTNSNLAAINLANIY